MPKNETIDVFKFIEMRGPEDCWPYTGGAWGGRARDKRPYFMAGGKRWLVYRLVWELVTGKPIPEGMLILHSCDQGGFPVGCSNPAHMRLGTVQDNSDDMTARQRHGLPTNVIKAIRRLLERGQTQQAIADVYGVSRELISAIATRRVYKRVDRAAGARSDGDPSTTDENPNERSHIE